MQSLQYDSKMKSEDFLKNLLELSDEGKIFMLASLFYKISEIALFLDKDEEEFRNKVLYETDSVESKAYRKGVMVTSIKLRFDTARFAFGGNPQADEEMRQYFTRLKLDEDA